MATVTGVTEETTVTMETASQRAIFEASKEKHAPSLIAVCVCVKERCVSPLSRVSCTDNETLTVGSPLCLYSAVYALNTLPGQFIPKNYKGLFLKTVAFGLDFNAQ